jgi:hypothetical protein
MQLSHFQLSFTPEMVRINPAKPFSSTNFILLITQSLAFQTSYLRTRLSLLASTISQVPLVRGNSSCSGQYYRANTSYTIPSIYNTYFTIANYIFEGLATFNSLIRENNCSEFSLDVGMKPRVLL